MDVRAVQFLRFQKGPLGFLTFFGMDSKRVLYVSRVRAVQIF